jgi:ornithine cyclodeaminase/alanine dehydrogenase-like protein (mu-crystallin family)
MKKTTQPAVAARLIVVLSNSDVEALASWDSVIEALRAGYRAPITDGMVPPRSIAAGRGVSMRGLTAVSPCGEHVGAKLLTVSIPEARPQVAVSYLVALFDRETAELVALLDGNHITGVRTAATSALAVDAVASTGPLRTVVLGSGFEAWNHLAAMAKVRDLATTMVFSPTKTNRESFAARATSELGVETVAVDDPSAAVQGADLVVCAARAHNETPILQGAWLRPGATVVSIGSTVPNQREVDVETLDRADRILVDVADEVVHHTGDAIEARIAGIEIADRVVSLSDVIAGRADARARDDEIIVYKSVGSALQDVVVAELVLERAVELGVGTRMPTFVAPVSK